MLTNNWRKAIASSFGKVDVPLSDGSTYSSSINMMATMNQISGVVDSLSSVDDKGLGMCFGSGTTSPTNEDITLESVIDGFTKINASITPFNSNDGDNQRLSTLVYTVQYTGEEDITINEVGIFLSFAYFTSTLAGSTLIAREILDEPVTMSTGQIRSFTFNIEG